MTTEAKPANGTTETPPVQQVAVTSPAPLSLWAQMERDMEEMRRHMSELVRRPFGSPRPLPSTSFSWSPTTDVYEKDGALVVKAELPGVKKDDISVAVERGVLTIAAQRAEANENKDARYYVAERFSGSLQRSLALPEGVTTDAITATFKDGVLEVRVPLPEQARSTSTSIKVTD
jgi:HSP20 family protein